MRAIGPGSVSSVLKIILDVVYVALWAGLAAAGVLVVLAILLSFNPALWVENVTLATGEGETPTPAALATGLGALGLYVAGVLVIVSQLRRIFTTLTAGDPFHPDNVLRLRIIGLTLAALELGSYAIAALALLGLPGVETADPDVDLTAWFSVMVVFVLAEVFREGARLRREAELTI